MLYEMGEFIYSVFTDLSNFGWEDVLLYGQRQTLESLRRRESRTLADAVKGLHLYGAKVVYPNEMVLLDLGVSTAG